MIESIIKYQDVIKIFEKHDVTLLDKFLGTLLSPYCIYKWYRIARRENIKLSKVNKDYWRILYK